MTSRLLLLLPLLLSAGLLGCRSAALQGDARRPLAESNADQQPEVSDERPSVAQLELRQRFAGQQALSSERGDASYYSDRLAGHSTASGEAYDPLLYTAAHRRLPFGTVVRVVRRDDGRSVYVRVNDRGPFGSRRRIIDLSRKAAEELGMVRRGVASVRLEVVETPPRHGR
ncbi:MAG TPA: septal ring lytic transglycosylase RlpA family protein [Polyangiaceae bacterium]|nr:septal ring lytic transglycosylase RlpA family protein [Polyangiaceae bacterium]